MSSRSSSRTCSVTPAPSANRSRKRRATSVPSPPMRASVRSTFDTRAACRSASSDDVGERFRGRHTRSRSRAPSRERPGEGPAEGAPGPATSASGVAGLDLERQVEPRVRDEQLEQPVEDRETGLDGGRAAAAELHANAAPSGCLLGVPMLAAQATGAPRRWDSAAKSRILRRCADRADRSAARSRQHGRRRRWGACGAR